MKSNLKSLFVIATVFGLCLSTRAESEIIDSLTELTAINDRFIELQSTYSSARKKYDEFIISNGESRPAVEQARRILGPCGDELRTLASRRESIVTKLLPQARQQLQALRDEIRNNTGQLDLSRDNLQVIARELSTQRSALRLQHAAANARREAIDIQISQAGSIAKKTKETDEITRELRTMLEIREQQLVRSEEVQKNGQGSIRAVDDARMNVAELRIKLATRQAEAAASGDLIPTLTRDLVNLTIAESERTAKLEYVEHELRPVIVAIDRLDELQTAEQNLAEAQKHWQASKTAVNWLELNVKSLK